MIHLGVESVCRKLIIWFVWFVVDKQELGARTNICVVCLPLCGQLKGFPSDSNVHNLYSQMMKPSSLNNDYDNTSLARQLLAWVQWRVNHFFSNLRWDGATVLRHCVQDIILLSITSYFLSTCQTPSTKKKVVNLQEIFLNLDILDLRDAVIYVLAEFVR